MRRLVAFALLACLTLTACGSDDSGLSGVKVSGGKTPKLTVPNALIVSKTTTRVVKPGKGHKLAAGDLARVRLVAANGSTGKAFNDTFGSGIPTYIPLSEQTQLPAFFADALKGQQKGSRLLVAVPSVVWSKTMDPSALTQVGITKQDAMLFYFAIDAVVPKGYDIKGKAVKPAAGAPVATFKAGKPVSIKASATTPATEAKYVLEKGTGKKLAKGGYYAAQYFGQVFPDGKVFDQSWVRGTALGGSLNDLIQCWKDLMPGAQEGSRVLLVCPKDVAYGASESPLKNDTLMFVIDVVDVA